MKVNKTKNHNNIFKRSLTKKELKFRNTKINKILNTISQDFKK